MTTYVPPAGRRWARPVVTRSRLVLEIAEHLASDNTWPFQQARVHLRAQGGGADGITVFGSDSPDAIDLVARGEVQFAVVNPAAPLALAVRGTGPFKAPIPLRLIGVIPSGDSYAFSVSESTGITSLEEIRDRRYPLRLSIRGQRDHGNHFLESVVLGKLGFSFDDIIAWGGEVRYDPGLPNGVATSGANVEHSRLDMAANGEIDAIFDEAVETWIQRAADLGFRILSLSPTLVDALEEMGFRRALLTREAFPRLPSDVLSLDFSGWPIYTHADVSDTTVTAFCDALDARKDFIPWQGTGPLPLERMCRDAWDTPVDIPFHPAAEAVWRARGYL